MDPLTRQVLSTTGGKQDPPYVDEVFNTYVKTGTNASVTINNGIDLATKGGMVWYKPRNATLNYSIIDTERGVQKYIVPNTTAGEITASDQLSAFNNNGFTWGDGVGTNDIAWWTFRKAPGFFDIVTYTGTGSNQSLAHNLECVPGCIIIKNLANGWNWKVYHTSLDPENPANYSLTLDQNTGRGESTTVWNDTEPTATHFTVGTNGDTNSNGSNYVAYLFAGGASTAATARSVYMSNNPDALVPSQVMIPSGQDSNKFCLETWFRLDNAAANQVIYSQYDSGSSGRMMFIYENKKVYLWMGGNEISFNTGDLSVYPKQWYHVAWTYDGTTHRMFLNGQLTDTLAGSSLPAGINQSNQMIGRGYGLSNWIIQGKLSNFRITLDQTVYTSNFRPSTIPLTTTSQGVTGTNCKILCCNSATLTNNDGSGVTLTTEGNPTAKTESPFDDPEGYKFGEDEDQSIIKMGFYEGSGSTLPVYLGWEPSYIILKRTNAEYDWVVFDNMRGIVTGGDDPYLRLNLSNSETDADRLDVTPTGFFITSNSTISNNSGGEYVYICIRRPDGLVGKPAEAGTDVLAMDYGAASGEPRLESGFPIDFAMVRQPATSENWYTGSRLTGANKIYTNVSDAMSSQSNFVWDYNDGWQDSSSTTYLSWMFKRHAGFDVVTYTGNGTSGHQINHSLGRVPAMIWVKCRNESQHWGVYHKGLNEGITPENYRIILNENWEESDNAAWWNDTAPTSTSFTVGNEDAVNEITNPYIAMLFADVEGISKCGIFSGTSTSVAVNLGFQPRYLIIKLTSSAGYGWFTWDSVRGMGIDPSPKLALNTTDAQDTGYQYFTVSSTGFEIFSSMGWGDHTGNKYIYYAHA